MAKWGTAQWGFDWRWGDSAEAINDYVQGYIPHAKNDTLFYGTFKGESGDDAQTANWGTDLSQYGIDWSESLTLAEIGAESSGSPLAHTQVYNNKSVEILVMIDTDQTGTITLIDSDGSGSPNGPTVRVDLNQSELQYSEGSSYQNDNDIDISSMLTGGWKKFVIALCSEEHPDRVGHALPIHNELMIFDVSGGTFKKSTFLTASRDPAAEGIWIEFGSSAAVAQSKYKALAARLGNRFHPAEEVYWDFVGSGRLVPETFTHKTRIETWLPDRSTTNVSNSGQMAGPTYAWAADAAKQNDALLMGPLVNWVCMDPEAIGWPTTTIEDNRMVTADEDSNYKQIVLTTCLRPIPYSCNAVRIKAMIDPRYDTASGSSGSFSVRAYSQGYQPGRLADDPDGNPQASYATQTVTASSDQTDIDEPAGSWVDFGVIPVQRNKKGFSWFCLGRNQNGSGGEYRYLYIRAFSVEPVIAEPGTSPAPIDDITF